MLENSQFKSFIKKPVKQINSISFNIQNSNEEQKSSEQHVFIRSVYTNKNQTIRNIIQMSNIEFLLKFGNFVDFNHKTIFERIKQQAQNQQQNNHFQNIYSKVYHKKLSQINLFKKQQIKKNQLIFPFQKFTKDQLISRQSLIQQTVKRSIEHNFSKARRQKTLSIEQLKYIAYSKIKQQKQNDSKQLQQSRRSNQYIQHLKLKINSDLIQQQHKNKQQTFKFKQQQLKRNFNFIEQRQQQRMSIKFQFYYYQKSSIKQEIQKAKILKQQCMNNLNQQYQIIMKTFVLIKQMQSLIQEIQNYYEENLQEKTQSYEKILSKTSLLYDYFEQNQKFLNKFYLDKRQIQISSIQ